MLVRNHDLSAILNCACLTSGVFWAGVLKIPLSFQRSQIQISDLSQNLGIFKNFGLDTAKLCRFTHLVPFFFKLPDDI